METGELKGNGQVSRGLPNQPQPLSKQWLAGRTPQPNVPQPPPRVTSHNHLTGQIPGRGGGADDGWARLAGYSLHFVTCGPRTCGLKVLKGWRPCLGQLESQYSVLRILLGKLRSGAPRFRNKWTGAEASGHD